MKLIYFLQSKQEKHHDLYMFLISHKKNKDANLFLLSASNSSGFFFKIEKSHLKIKE